MSELLQLFETQYDLQGEIQVTPLKGKDIDTTPYAFVSKEPARITSGVLHHEGYVIATDGYSLIGDKSFYNPDLELRVVDKDGNILEGRFPNWKSVIPQNPSFMKIDPEKVSGQLRTVRQYRKEGLKKEKTKGSKKSEIDQTLICVRFPNDIVAHHRLAKFELFFAAMRRLKLNSISLDSSGSPLFSTGDIGFLLSAPWGLDSSMEEDNCPMALIDLKQ